ncbi:uncharacterized protein LOC144477651, partial [Augochlora pura]
MNSPSRGLSIIQINLHRCKLAQDILTQYVLENNIYIVLISEPYRHPTQWFVDDNGDAAIWVTPPALKTQINIKSSYKDKGFMAIKFNELEIVSCYISPNIFIQHFEEILDKLEKEIGKSDSRNTIIAGDLNSKAVAWGSKRTDLRGYKIIEMANRNDLVLIKSDGDYTFERAG